MDCNNLIDYLDRYRHEITARVSQEAPPLYTPGTDEPHPQLVQSLRAPYPAQADVITAISKTLHDSAGAYVCGEMGTGKTLIGALVCWLHKPAGRFLVMCPGHLVRKWEREIRLTVPDAEAYVIENLSDAIAAQNRPNTGKPQFYILSKETGKLGYFLRPGVRVKRVQQQVFDTSIQISGTVPVLKCTGLYMKTIIEDYCYCPHCSAQVELPPRTKNDLPVPILLRDLERHPRKKCPKCEAPLWTADRTRTRKVAIADYFKRKRARFDVFIADEAHELKGEDTAQGNALGKLASCSDKVLCLTGTLIGGYSSHLFYLNYRLDPAGMKKAGFTYGQTDPWVEKYGVKEVVIKEIEICQAGNARSHGTKTGSRTSASERPGISPALFAEQLLNSAVFLHLEDVAHALPPITERPVSVEMSPELTDAYRKLEYDIKKVMSQQLAQGNRRLLGRFLTNLLSYPDKPFENPPVELEQGSYAYPRELSQDLEYPKEQKLIELVQDAKRNNRKALIFLTYTGKRDTQPRIKKLLADYGITAEILYAKEVKPAQREKWIENISPTIDALIVNPEAVKTGLDLIDFPTVIYLQTGYSVFTLRQSSRRSWRIGQTQPVEIYYLYYADTMQSRAINLIGKKLSASVALEGKLTAEGLQAMAGDDEDAALALARALCQGGLSEGIESVWRSVNEKNAATVKAQERPETSTAPTTLALPPGEDEQEAATAMEEPNPTLTPPATPNVEQQANHEAAPDTFTQAMLALNPHLSPDALALIRSLVKGEALPTATPQQEPRPAVNDSTITRLTTPSPQTAQVIPFRKPTKKKPTDEKQTSLFG